MQLYFAEVKNILDPLKMGRVQVFVFDLEDPVYKVTGSPNSEWFYCMSTNNSSSVLYDIGDRVVVTFLNSEANNVGLVLGRVSTLGTSPIFSPFVNGVEQGAYPVNQFGIAYKAVKLPQDPLFTFSPYPLTRTPVYHKNLLLADDEKQSLIQDSKGSFIFFDKLSNLFIKSILTITIYCVGLLSLFSTSKMEFKVGVISTITVDLDSIELKVGPSSVKLSPIGVEVKGPSIWLN